MAAAAGGIMSGLLSTAGNMQTAEGYQQLSAAQQEFLQSQLAKIEGVAQPTFNTNLPSPQQLALQQLMNPKLAQATNISINPQDRQNEINTLSNLQAVASGAADSELNAANYKAMQNAAQQQQGANGAILQNMASRGTLGSGQELAAKMQAAQNGANNSQAGMLQAAAANNQAKLGAQNMLLAGQQNLTGQDTGLATANANIANQFNMANTNAINATNNANTGIANTATTANTNANNAYQTALIQLQNSAAQQEYNNKLGQAEAGAGEANTISNNAMNAGGIGLTLNANTMSGAAQSLGNFGNALSSLQNPSSGSGYSNVSSPSIPSTQLTDPTSSFGGSSQSGNFAGPDDESDSMYG